MGRHGSRDKRPHGFERATRSVLKIQQNNREVGKTSCSLSRVHRRSAFTLFLVHTSFRACGKPILRLMAKNLNQRSAMRRGIKVAPCVVGPAAFGPWRRQHLCVGRRARLPPLSPELRLSMGVLFSRGSQTKMGLRTHFDRWSGRLKVWPTLSYQTREHKKLAWGN